MSDANFQDVQNPYAAPYAEVGVKPGSVGPVANFRGYAGFWLRFVAYVIDVIVLGFVGFFLGIFGGILAATMGGGDSSTLIVAGVQIVNLLVNVCYYAFMESSSSQATLGKMALGLKVVDYQGHRISFGRAIGRFFAKILSGIILAIGYIMIAFTERKQGLHDKIASTFVIKTR